MLRTRQEKVHTADTALPGPTVYRLASERRYGEIPAHVRDRPQDVHWEDRYGSTALHVLCCSRQVGDPLLRAIDSILQVDSSLVQRPNEATWTPLHLACEKRLLWRNNEATATMVLRLLDACPSAVSIRLQNGYRAKTPFHIACETNAEETVIRRMLDICPSLALQTYARQRGVGVRVQAPLELLWETITRDRHVGEDFGKMQLVLDAAFTTIELPTSVASQHDNNNGAHDTSTAINIATTTRNAREQTIWRLLCASSAIPCPRPYLSRIWNLHERHIRARPEDRIVPLHYACWKASPETPGYTSFVVHGLVEADPRAAQRPFPCSRLYPLHVLLSGRSMTWDKEGLSAVAMASADVLCRPDPRHRLVPALASAMDAHRSRLHLTTTYELLRLAPEILQDGFWNATAS